MGVERHDYAITEVCTLRYSVESLKTFSVLRKHLVEKSRWGP